MRLEDLGWDEPFAEAFATPPPVPDVEPGRIAVEFNYLYRVYVQDGEIEAVLAGRIKHHAVSRGEFPAVGDWVVVRRRANEAGVIVRVLPRRTKFSRRMAGQETDEQVVASNVAIIFVVMALDADFSVRRLERYLLMSHESGAEPVVVLTKPDLADDLPSRLAEVATVAAGAPIHVVSPRSGEGLDLIRARLTPGVTGALLGSSGVGKTTIINRLVGNDLRRTREVRESDAKGRHTTTHRELILLPGGGLLIDTPGMRELQLWDAPDALRQSFEDVESLAAGCRFGNCRHRDEPRCAVKEAVAEGKLDADRLESYHRLQEELAFLAQQQDQRAQTEERRRSKVQSKALRAHYRNRK